MLSLSVSALVLVASVAFADEIGPTPECPDGARGESSHCGEWCEPFACPADGCPTGSTCRPVGLCIVTETQPQSCGRVRESPMVQVEKVTGTCESDGDCASGTCVKASRCARPAGGGLCSFGSIMPVGLGLALMVGALKPR